MAGGFRVLEHTADVGLEAWGADTAEAFASAARGMFAIMVELEEVREREERRICVTAASEEDLLVAWLGELLYYLDTENRLFCRFEIERLEGGQLEARAFGEVAEAGRHHFKAVIKAVTYHMLEIDHTRGCRVRVLFDI